jgi:colanic acid biosynthesis glycosyl transferase WcaI
MAKIAYFAPYFWPESIGSAPYCTDVARWLQKQGHEVSVTAFRPHYPRVEDFPAYADGERDRETVDGIHITRIRVGKRGGGMLARLQNDLRYFAGAVRAAWRPELSDVDTVVAYVPSALAVLGAMTLSWRTGARLVAVIHDIESGLASSLGMAQGNLLLSAMRTVERLAFNRAQHIIVLSSPMADELKQLGCERPITALPIWSATIPYVPVARSSKPVVCYSGNFGKKQNLDQLLPMLALLGAHRPDVQVVLRGEGTERARIEEQVASMGLTNTTFLPLAPTHALGKTLQDATLHLVPQASSTASYALPSKIFSIMAAGRAFLCIAEKDTPLHMLARRTRAGVCVAPDDPQALFAAVVRLLDDHEANAAMGRRGQAFVRENMDRSKIMAEYERIILGQAADVPAAAAAWDQSPEYAA